MMRRHKLPMTFVSVAAFAVACRPTAERPAIENREATTRGFDKVAKETNEAEAKRKLGALRENASRLKTQFDEAKSGTEATWNTVKAGSRETYRELKDSFQRARQWASEKIAS